MPDNKRYYIRGDASKEELEAFIKFFLDELEADGHVFPPDESENPTVNRKEPRDE